jgi:hypothetical protein
VMLMYSLCFFVRNIRYSVWNFIPTMVTSPGLHEPKRAGPGDIPGYDGSCAFSGLGSECS